MNEHEVNRKTINLQTGFDASDDQERPASELNASDELGRPASATSDASDNDERPAGELKASNEPEIEAC